MPMGLIGLYRALKWIWFYDRDNYTLKDMIILMLIFFDG